MGITIVVLGLVAVGASVAAWILHARSFVPITRRTVLVCFVDANNPTLRGVLFCRRGGFFTFKSVSLVQSDGSLVPLDGDVIVERARILFLQVLPHP